MNNFNEEFEKMIVEMYEGGEPVSKLSVEYDVSRPTIYNWIKQYKTIETPDGETTDLNEIRQLKREMLKLENFKNILSCQRSNSIFPFKYFITALSLILLFKSLLVFVYIILSMISF